MAAFNPDLITDPRLHKKTLEEKAPIVPIPQPEPAPVSPIAPPVAPIIPPQPIIIPVPFKAKKPEAFKISMDVARKAQSIYPAEQQAKQNMIENAKAPPTLGAWGKPKQ